jgi:uncharacterized protein YbjT (DUF2867 family)
VSRRTVLVAGATGYLGHYLTLALKEAGWRVRVLVRDASKLAEVGPALAPALEPHAHEVWEADVTQPATLRGSCKGVDVVISTVSMMSDTGPLTWDDVDHRGNRNLLDEAQSAGVQKMCYLSVFNAERMIDIPMVRAHEAFVKDLIASGLDYTVIRPTGYFSDMGAFLDMAKRGRVFLLGNGHNAGNPIHGADLAEFCIGKLDGESGAFDVGGPETLTLEEIATLAFRVAGQPARVTKIPLPVASVGVSLYRSINRKQADLARFFLRSSSMDFQAPPFGSRRLADYFRELE